MKLIAKYEAEQKELSTEVASLEEKFTTIRQDEEDVALFMERLRKYTDVQELTREMCLELIEYITLDAYVEGQPREIYIYYKLLDEPLKALEDEFGERFVRIHRNALVARERIERLQRTPLGHFQLYLKGLGPDALTVSRRHVAGVRKLMHSL